VQCRTKVIDCRAHYKTDGRTAGGSTWRQHESSLITLHTSPAPFVH